MPARGALETLAAASPTGAAAVMRRDASTTVALSVAQEIGDRFVRVVPKMLEPIRCLAITLLGGTVNRFEIATRDRKGQVQQP
jgi:hypothetical protein